jgi:SAM-dependent methyltransferase
MPVWTTEERHELRSILDVVMGDLEPLAGHRILVLCSATGEVAFRVGERIGDGEVIGLEFADDLRQAAEAALAAGPNRPVRFQKALLDRIPFPDESFDAVVSEFIVYPTSQATDIGQPEMARVLRPGGVMTITDVIVPTEPPSEVRADLSAVGLDYLCVATPQDFQGWMDEAGMIDVEIRDLTAMVRPVWEKRLSNAPDARAAHHLLGSGPWSLGHGLRYIRVRGTKPT